MLLVSTAMLMALAVLLHGAWQDWQRGEQTMHERATAVARFYQTRQIMRVSATEVLLQTLAQTPAVRDGASERLADFMRRLDIAQPDYLGFAVFDPEGQALVAVAGGQNFMAQPADQVREHRYFRRALENKVFAVGLGLASRSQPGKMFLPMALPVMGEHGTVLSVLFAPLDMGRLTQEDMDSGIAQLMQQHNMSVRILDTEGRILYQSPEHARPPLGEVLTSPCFQEALAEPGDTVILDQDCADMGRTISVLLKTRSAPGQDPCLYVLVQTPRPSWIYFLRVHYYGALLAVVGSLLFGLMVARLVGRHFFSQGLSRLVRVARSTQDGRMDMRCGALTGCREIQALGTSVDAMLDELQRGNKLLREQGERLDMALDAADMGMWRWYAVSEFLHMDERAWEILGYCGQDRESANGLGMAYPADVEAFRRALVEHQQGANLDFSCEMRMRRGDNETAWVLFAGRLARREQDSRDVQGLCLDVTARRRVEELEHEQMEHYRRLSTTDPLTGLWNRRHFNETAHNEVLRCLRNGNSVAVIMTDIDFFKKVNDTFGHAGGDEVLRHFAKVMRNTVRTTDLVARYGGEEFVLLLPETRIAEATLVAEKIRAAYEGNNALWEGRAVVSTASFGVCAYTPDMSTAGYAGQKIADDVVERMIAYADAALYTSKQEGRNRVTACKASINEDDEPESQAR